MNELTNMSELYPQGLNQMRIDKMITVTDDWYPCFENNTVQLSMFISYLDKHTFVRICVWGADDFGLEKDYHDSDYNNLISKYNEWKETIFDAACDGIDQNWFRNRGFYNV